MKYNMFDYQKDMTPLPEKHTSEPSDAELHEIEDEFGEMLKQDHFEMIRRRTERFDDDD